MFFTKRQKAKLVNEIRELNSRISDLSEQLNALASQQGLAISRNYFQPKFTVLKKEEMKTGGSLGSCMKENFSL